ncbi:tripartite tricarboxylate transporter TctB family protein [Roseivivax sp. CAU 1761]
MRIAFLVAILAGALFYSYVAFIELPFLTRTGRLAAGFFPRLIGVTAVVITAWALLDELRNRHQDTAERQQWLDVAALVALALGYGVLLRLLGGFPATVIFLGFALTYFNRGRHLRNALIAVLVPAGVYLLFDRVLNASMPPALLDLPI